MPSLPYVSLPSMPTELWSKMRALCPPTPRGWRLSTVGKRPRVSSVSARHSMGQQRPSLVPGSPASLVLEGSSDLADYQLLGVLGRGTFGVVRLAKHKATGRAVAIKILDKHQVRAMKQEVNILREQSVHLKLNHAFVGRIYTTFQDHDAVYFVLEYCPGGELYSLVYSNEEDDHPDGQDPETTTVVVPDPLDDECLTESDSSSSDEETNHALTPTLRRKRSLSMDNTSAMRALAHPTYGGLREPHVAFYLACVVSGLGYLHENQDVLYRDLKLENLVLGEDGYPKLIDFGLSKPDFSRGTNTTMCGSKEYIAPEVVQRQAYDHRADLWSLGVLMFELCFGATPFYHPNAREQSRRICEQELSFPNNFEDEFPNACTLMRSLLAKRPQDRPTTCRAVRQSAFFKAYYPTAKSWQQVENKQVKAPFVPVLSGPFDTSLFANAYEEDDEDSVEAFVQC